MKRVLTEEQKAARREYMKVYNVGYYAANRERFAADYAENPDKYSERNAAYRAANTEKDAERHAKYYAENKAEITEKRNAYVKMYPERKAKSQADYRRTKPEKHCAVQSRRRATKVKATPTWADNFAIAEAYELAQLRTKTTGAEWHVDHIVPLKSRLVCGLHCEFNLQVILGRDNIAKLNRYWPNMP